MNQGVLEEIREEIRFRATGKRAADTLSPESLAAFSRALADGQAAALKSNAVSDIKNVLLAGLGVGAAYRGGLGLVNLLSQDRKRRMRTPVTVSNLPYPVSYEKTGGIPDDVSTFISELFDGNKATAKWGIPWYLPSMAAATLGGGYAGYKVTDAVLDSQKKPAREAEIDKAREAFRNALLMQYDKPVTVKPGLMPPGGKLRPVPPATEETDVMKRAAAVIDECFELFTALSEKAAAEKTAFTYSDLAGGAAGVYGTGAGLTALITGALVYNAAKNRSRKKLLDSAVARIDRRKFRESPTEIYAVPEPVSAMPKRPSPKEELALLRGEANG